MLLCTCLAVLILFVLKMVKSLFTKCGPFYYKITHEWTLMPFFIFLVPITIFSIIECSRTDFSIFLGTFSFLCGILFFILLLMAVAFALQKILLGKNKLTMPLFQYQNGFLYSIFILKIPQVIYYTIPLILYIICSVFMGFDYPKPNYIIGTWAAFIACLLVLISKIVLRPFKTMYMNICEMILDGLFCLMWIPLLYKVHKKNTNPSCSGGGLFWDLLFPLLAMLWIIGSLVGLVLYLLRRRKQKSSEFIKEEKS